MWPFDGGLGIPDNPVVFAELYPSLLKDVVSRYAKESEIHDRAQVRVNARARRLRPLARRAAKILRPFFVGIRERKPCRRLRLTLSDSRGEVVMNRPTTFASLDAAGGLAPLIRGFLVRLEFRGRGRTRALTRAP